MGGLGLFFAIVLAAANEKFKVEEDPKVQALSDALPAINCGACGYLSCHDYAEHLAGGEEPINKCKPGGDNVQQLLANILGVKSEKTDPVKLVVHCSAGRDKRQTKASYKGVETCLGASLVAGGPGDCLYGCLGLGDCFSACKFDAIKMINGLPVFDYEKCIQCGKCILSCPRALISSEKLERDKTVSFVACSSKDKGPDTRKACTLGCIGCGICQKMTDGDFVIQDNCARRVFDKIKDSNKKNIAFEKCPTKVIKSI
jgi:electron transport complex protein RnfB